jgi:flagellar hook assembly protein FlgD
MDFTVNGKDATILNPAYVDLSGNSEVMHFIFPGITTPGHAGVSFTDFTWNGSNDGGQPVDNGIFYIKISVKDAYGHTDTTIKDVTVIRTDEYVRLNIYNEAGELVKRIEEPGISDSKISLDVKDIIVVNNTTEKVNINYGPASIAWDGTNAEGKMVSSGIYEIQIQAKTASGITTDASKTVTIINDSSKDALGAVKVYPNPCVIDNEGNGTMKFEWSSVGFGKVAIRIYNIYGELVARLDANRTEHYVIWHANSSSGSHITSGVYICVIEGVKDTGEREVKKLKAVLVRKISDANNGQLN